MLGVQTKLVLDRRHGWSQNLAVGVERGLRGESALGQRLMAGLETHLS